MNVKISTSAKVFFAAAALFLSACSRSTDFSVENYNPSAEFGDAFVTISQAAESNPTGYDLEKTIRVIHGMELAQVESTSFSEYLEYMAKQDYSNVAPDVLEAKKRLFPVLEQMKRLEAEHKELGDLWMLARSAGAGVGTLTEDMQDKGLLISAVTLAIQAHPLALVTMAGNEDLDKAKNAAFDHYQEEAELKSKLEGLIEEVHEAYVDYLTAFTPVYNKYMREWDALCSEKDKAYRQIYSGQMTEAYNTTSKILEQYPNNREAMLMKSMSLVYIGASSNKSKPALSLPEEGFDPEPQTPSGWNNYLIEADQTLNSYSQMYPEYSAPMNLLKGLLYQAVGEQSKAMTYYDMSSQEYPRQAEKLTDMLDSYAIRTSYLNRTAEGLHLLSWYQSTMEGFGIFSPNLQKAQYYAQQGDLARSKDEIFNHFFRRSNQDVYDCLLSDMEYCEQNMKESLRQLLVEQSYIDLSVEKASKYFGLSDKDDVIKVKVKNRTDINLENVRVFLCIHYTDMYKDQYDVVKVPMSKNIIPALAEVDLGEVELTYQDKKYDDISRIRAIAVTDDKICWVDNLQFKEDDVMKVVQSQATGTTDQAVIENNEAYLSAISLNAEKLAEQIKKGFGVTTNVTKGSWFSSDKKQLVYKFPRLLTFIDPVFTIGEPGPNAMHPTVNVLSGPSILVQFDYVPAAGDHYELYVTSKYSSYRLDISSDGTRSTLNKISVL